MSHAISPSIRVQVDAGQVHDALRDGVLHIEGLPFEDRTAAYRMPFGSARGIARFGLPLAGRDRLAAASRTGTDVLTELAADPSERRLPDTEVLGPSFLFVSWPELLDGVDSLVLIFPPGGGGVGRD
jgi:hypothetical protein